MQVHRWGGTCMSCSIAIMLSFATTAAAATRITFHRESLNIRTFIQWKHFKNCVEASSISSSQQCLFVSRTSSSLFLSARHKSTSPLPSLICLREQAHVCECYTAILKYFDALAARSLCTLHSIFFFSSANYVLIIERTERTETKVMKKYLTPSATKCQRVKVMRMSWWRAQIRLEKICISTCRKPAKKINSHLLSVCSEQVGVALLAATCHWKGPHFLL